MGQVTVTVAEKIYRIACNDGQEAHLMRLASELDKKIGEMRTAFGEIGDSRLTVMAAITFMDEREEIKTKLSQITTELATLKEDRAVIEAAANKAEMEIAAAVAAAAGQIEAIAKRLSDEAN